MCQSCWEEYGSPTSDDAHVLAAVPLIAAVYEGSAVGGGMHVQLDDWNLDDEFFDEESAGSLRNDAERACFAAMAPLAIAERAAALAIYDGFTTPAAP